MSFKLIGKGFVHFIMQSLSRVRDVTSTDFWRVSEVALRNFFVLSLKFF